MIDESNASVVSPSVEEHHAQAVPSVERTYHVGRRITLSFMAAVTLLFSVIFSGLKAIEAPFQVYLFVMTLVALTAVAQAYFGRSPRVASAIAGVVAILPWDFYEVVFGFGEMDGSGNFESYLLVFFATLPFVAAFGALIGYLAGGLSAGLVLLLDKVEHREV